MPLHPSFACISAQVRPLRHDTLNRAHQEALEAEIWYTEKNYKSLSPKPTNSKDPVKPNFSQPRSVFQHGSTIPKYPSINIILQPIMRHRNKDFKHSAKTVSDLDIMNLNVTQRREIFLLATLQLVLQTEFSACRRRTTIRKTSQRFKIRRKRQRPSFCNIRKVVLHRSKSTWNQ